MTRRGSGGGTWRQSASQHGRPTEARESETFESIESREGGLEGWLGTLATELREERYRPQAVRRVMIPKPDGGGRPLGIPTIRDRVVQQAARLVVEPIFEAEFDPNAYGYAKRGALDAVNEVRASISRGESHVVDADFSRYFGAPGEAWRLQQAGFPPR